jgi:phage/plasmid-associated DNA primase
MLKQFLLKKLMASQLSKLPPEQRALIEKLMMEKPDLLMQLAQDVQALIQSGKSQEEAMLEIAKKYEGELKGFLGK